MVIREIIYQDYHQIEKLVKKHKMKIYDQLDWERIWKNNPYIKENKITWLPGWVIEENENIVGHIANIPVEYYYNFKPYLGSMISCWVVDNKFRYLSIKLLQKFISQKNTDFLIGTTANFKTAKVFTAFGWKKNPMQAYNEKLYVILDLKNLIRSYFKKKKISLGNIFNNIIYLIINFIFFKKINYWKNLKTKKEFVIYNKFNEKFDNFWNKTKEFNKNIFMLNRNKEWINWHLNHQFKNNEAWILAEEENDEIVGYCICLYKYDDAIDLKKVILIDYVSLNNNDETLLNLLIHAVKIAKKKNSHLFEIIGFNDEKRKVIKKIKPFLRRVSFCPFYFYSNKLELEEILQKKDSWDSSILDGDSII